LQHTESVAIYRNEQAKIASEQAAATAAAAESQGPLDVPPSE